MTKISDALTYGITLRESANDGSDFTNPVADYRRLFLGEDGALHVKDSAGAVTSTASGIADQGAFTYLDATEGAAPGTPSANKVRVYAKADGRIYSKDDGGVEYGPFDAAGAGGTIPSPDTEPASPNANDQEFNAAHSGSTTLGTLDTDSVSNYPGLLDIRRTAGAWNVNGLYWATPAIPFTLTARLVGHNVAGAYQHVGVMILEASPGKLITFGPAWEAALTVDVQLWTNRTTRSSNSANLQPVPPATYYRIVVTSATSVAYQVGYPNAYGGGTWVSVVNTNPGFTPAKWGVFVIDYNGALTKAAFDYVRFVTGTAGQTWNGTAWA